MKKLFLIFCIILISGCNMSTNNPSETEIIEENSVAPNIMVNDCLYHTTGELYDGRFYLEAKEEDYNQHVSSSAYSRSPPTGRPLARRDTSTPNGLMVRAK